MTKSEAKMTKSKKIPYKPEEIEPKWQSKWQKEGTYQPDLDSANGSASSPQRQPFYNLMMFPYPSAEGLHIGGVRTFGGVDIYGRFQRMRGKNVFEPFGLDGFGIHAENYALKIGAHPMDHSEVTENNYYRQVREAGIAVDWSRTVETYKPDYYKWTQWLFLQLFKAGLAYRKKSPVNFCPGCKTVLADEQVIDGQCERCSSVVEKRDLEQWFFRITKYAERLLNNIDSLNWTDKVRLAQRNWIGRSEGANVEFRIKNQESRISVFTTRPDTLFGATFLVISPEHNLVPEILHSAQDDKQRRKIEKYVNEAKMKSELERTAEGKEKTGVFSGVYAVNPVNNKQIPVWIADYVLAGYGTGAIMAVPAHDQRDFDFAKKFDLPIQQVIKNPESASEKLDEAYTGTGVLTNSGMWDGWSVPAEMPKVLDWLEEKGIGKREVTYHLRDWLISRQRYWGPPIPMIHCENCAMVKPKIVLIHGLSGHSKENWFPWFRHELAAKGYEVLIPDLPGSDKPKLSEWLDALKALGVSKRDKLFVVGHSLGGPTACQYILQNGFQVEKLVLIAPTGNEMEEMHQENLVKGGLDPVGVEVIRAFNDANTKMDELKKLVREVSLYLSHDDPYIPVSVKKTYQALKPKLVEFSSKGHFNANAGLTEFAELLNEFPSVDELNLGWHPVSDEELPVRLPHIKDFKPLGTGKAPLANHPEFYKTTCPVCGKEARRETDVSDTFLDSAWYFLRYLATDWDDVAFPSVELAKRSKNQEARSKESEERKNFLPVTMYIGGAEHSVLHLLYARFTTMVLHDLGYLDFEEPFTRFYAHGLVIKDGAKMSKSKGNVITPDVYIRKFGADAVRTYLHFLGPFNQDGDFRDTGIEGMNRFLKRVWALFAGRIYSGSGTDIPAKRFLHKTVKGVTEDMEDLRFNTAIAKLMTWYNFLAKQNSISREEGETYLKLLAPFAPHMTEELWQELKGDRQAGTEETKGFESIHKSSWPEYEEKYITTDVVTIAVQVNGKLRGTVQASLEQAKTQKVIEEAALADEHVQKFLDAVTIRKVIYIPNKILNFVVS